MAMGGEIEPRRLALRFEPPAIIVEYAQQKSYRTQLYHHVIDVEQWLPSSKAASISDWEVSDIVNKIVKLHASVLEGVSTEQVKRLVKKLANQDNAKSTTKTSSLSREPMPAAVPLPQADYNRVSETQLRQVKDKMDVVFQQKLLRPGDEGYQYDKQVSFTPSEDASDWDD